MMRSVPPSGPMVTFTLPVAGSILTVVVIATSWPFQLIVLVPGAAVEQIRVHGREAGRTHVSGRDVDERRDRTWRDRTTPGGVRSTTVVEFDSSAGVPSEFGNRESYTRTGVGRIWVVSEGPNPLSSSLVLQLAPDRAGRERSPCGR